MMFNNYDQSTTAENTNPSVKASANCVISTQNCQQLCAKYNKISCRQIIEHQINAFKNCSHCTMSTQADNTNLSNTTRNTHEQHSLLIIDSAQVL